MADSLIKLKLLEKEISGIFDPTFLISELKKSPSLLLESADVVTKLGEKSLVLTELAIKFEGRANKVFISLLQSEAKEIFLSLKNKLKTFLIEETESQITLSFPSMAHETDVMAKRHKPSMLDSLRTALKIVAFENSDWASYFMLGGVFSYDFLDHFEALPKAKNDDLNFPDFLFYLPLNIVLLDHKNMKTKVLSWQMPDDSKGGQQRLRKLNDLVELCIQNYKPDDSMAMDSKNGLPQLKVDLDDNRFAKIIEQCKEHIIAGDVYQIVPSRCFKVPLKNPMACYQKLRKLNPSPYMFLVSTKEWLLLGASPETFIKVDENGQHLSIRPIAGTRRRGLDKFGKIDAELDAREQTSLCLDEKELSEHMMLVDLARNDIASVCKAGTRRIKRLLGVDRFSHVMHLVSEVEGILDEGMDALTAYQSSMNMGTLMGAPKIRAAQILRELEPSKRGFYGGAVGYLNANGDMDTAIIIRSALVKDGQAYVRAGCGVVFDSDVSFEVEETKNKAEAVLRAIELSGEL